MNMDPPFYCPVNWIVTAPTLQYFSLLYILIIIFRVFPGLKDAKTTFAASNPINSLLSFSEYQVAATVENFPVIDEVVATPSFCKTTSILLLVSAASSVLISTIKALFAVVKKETKVSG